MKRILIFALTLVLTNLGNWLFRGCEITTLQEIIKTQASEIEQDSIVISEMSFEIDKLKQKDSSNQFFINEKEKVLIDQRNIIRTKDNELVYLRKWKADAEEDGIITPDTVRVRKRFFRKGYKVVR